MEPPTSESEKPMIATAEAVREKKTVLPRSVRLRLDPSPAYPRELNICAFPSGMIYVSANAQIPGDRSHWPRIAQAVGDCRPTQQNQFLIRRSLDGTLQ